MVTDGMQQLDLSKRERNEEGQPWPGPDLVAPGVENPGPDLVAPGVENPGPDLVAPGMENPGPDPVAPGRYRTSWTLPDPVAPVLGGVGPCTRWLRLCPPDTVFTVTAMGGVLRHRPLPFLRKGGFRGRQDFV